MQHYVIKFVRDMRQVDDFLQKPRFPSPIKLAVMIYIAELLLKVALNTITITRVRCFAVLVPVSVIAVCLIMSYDTASGILQKKFVLFISLYERVFKKSNLITLLLHDKNVQKKYYTMLNRIDFAFLANLISYIKQKKT